MQYHQLTNEEIIIDLMEKIDKIRIQKGLKDSDLVKLGGCANNIPYKLRQGTTGVTIASFIAVLRGVGELDRLEKLFGEEIDFRPSMLLEKKTSNQKKSRVRKKTQIGTKPIQWGESK